MLHGVEDSLGRAITTIERFGERTAESAFYSIVQEPIDGLTQLANHVVKPLTGYALPHLEVVGAPQKAKFGSVDGIADTIGTGIGRAIDYVILSRALGGAGLNAIESASARAAIVGGVYGFAVIPSPGESNFWSQRLVTGLGWSAGAAVATVLAGKASGLLSSRDLPAEALENRAFTTMVKGSTSGITKTAVYQLFQVERAGAQPFMQRALQGVTKSLITDALP